jgi:hypothetical protein
MDEIEVSVDKALDGVTVALLRFAKGAFPYTAKAVEDATIHARDTWRTVANQTLRTSTGTYIRYIVDGKVYPYENDPLRGAVVTRDPKAAFVEHGYGPFDMKPGLLRSDKAKVSKEGHRYMTVPLRHGTPRTGATEAGRGEERATLASVMPTGVAKMAEKLVRSHMKGGPGQKRLPDMGWFWQTKLTPRLLGLPAYTWKHGKFAGLVKTGVSGHTQYMTFRTVSAKKSDPGSWIHPGHGPMRLCEQARNQCDPDVREILKRGFEKDMEEIRRQMIEAGVG